MLLKWPDKCSVFSVRQGKVRPILAPFSTYLPWYICYKFQEFRVLYNLVAIDFTMLFPIRTEPGGLCSGLCPRPHTLWNALPAPTTHLPVHKMPIWPIWVWHSDQSPSSSPHTSLFGLHCSKLTEDQCLEFHLWTGPLSLFIEKLFFFFFNVNYYLKVLYFSYSTISALRVENNVWLIVIYLQCFTLLFIC